MINQNSKISKQTVPFSNVRVGGLFEDNGVIYKKINQMNATSNNGAILTIIHGNYLVNKVQKQSKR